MQPFEWTLRSSARPSLAMDSITYLCYMGTIHVIPFNVAVFCLAPLKFPLTHICLIQTSRLPAFAFVRCSSVGQLEVMFAADMSNVAGFLQSLRACTRSYGETQHARTVTDADAGTNAENHTYL